MGYINDIFLYPKSIEMGFLFLVIGWVFTLKSMSRNNTPKDNLIFSRVAIICFVVSLLLFTYKLFLS